MMLLYMECGEKEKRLGWLQVFLLRKLVMTITNLINPRGKFRRGDQKFGCEHKWEMPMRHTAGDRK